MSGIKIDNKVITKISSSELQKYLRPIVRILGEDNSHLVDDLHDYLDKLNTEHSTMLDYLRQFSLKMDHLKPI